MVSLHEAIRNVQDELIKSERIRREKGIAPLFMTEKLTIEFSCVFTEGESTDAKGGVHALSVLTLDAATASSVKSEEVQKVIMEFRAIEMEKPEENNHTIPKHNERGILPHKE